MICHRASSPRTSGLTSGKTETFLYHLLALVIVAAFSFIGSLILYKVTDLIIPLRVTEEQEEEGLDLSQHGETAMGADILGGFHAQREENRDVYTERRLTQVIKVRPAPVVDHWLADYRGLLFLYN